MVRRLIDLMRNLTTRLLTPAEDPRQVFAGSEARYAQLQRDLQGALAEVAKVKGRLAESISFVSTRLVQLEEETMATMEQGQDDLARSVDARSLEAKEALEELKTQEAQLAVEERRLMAAERRLASQIERLSTHHQVAATRATTSEAQARLKEALGNVARELAAFGIVLEDSEDRLQVARTRANAIEARLQRHPREESGSAPPRNDLGG
jgi:phage shock protein A